jgi:hypothetical protein
MTHSYITRTVECNLHSVSSLSNYKDTKHIQQVAHNEKSAVTCLMHSESWFL